MKKAKYGLKPEHVQTASQIIAARKAKGLSIPELRFIVSLSSGASSAVATERILQVVNPDDVRLVFMDTLWEDDDNYRFLDQLAERWNKRIIRLTNGRNPMQVGSDENIIPNQKYGICTKRLKIEPFMKYINHQKRYGYQLVTVLGMNWTEPHRTVSPYIN